MDDTADSRGHSRDLYASYDEQRESCPVAQDRQSGFILLRHADVWRALHDHQTFSNRVSRHLSVPNSMDPPEHTPYRRIVEKYFTEARVASFEPACRALAASLVENSTAQREPVEVMAAIALPYAARAQCAYLGWPQPMVDALLHWTRTHQKAIRESDQAALTRNAAAFQKMIAHLLQTRRDDVDPPSDLTTHLMREELDGRRLNEAEIVSVLRNWTAGEVGTISASVGILAHFVAEHPDLQHALRSDLARLPYAIDEILRCRGPLLSNRRIATRPVVVGGQEIPAQERVMISWVSANRDGRAFAEPLAFRWNRDPGKNLLYGAGMHVCPGAPLARLELRVLAEELLTRTASIELTPGQPAVPADPPAGGFALVPLTLARA